MRRRGPRALLRLSRLALAGIVVANAVPLLGIAFLRWSLLEVVTYVWLEGVVLALATVARIAIAARRHALWIAPLFVGGAALALALQLLLLTLAFFVMRFQDVGVTGALAEAQAVARGLAWGAGALAAWQLVALVVFARYPARPSVGRIILRASAHLGALLVFSVAAVYLVRDLRAPALALGVFVALKIAIDVALALSERAQASSGIL